MRWCMHIMGTEPHAEKRTNIVSTSNPFSVAAIVVTATVAISRTLRSVRIMRQTVRRSGVGGASRCSTIRSKSTASSTA
jgi:hypothetical protein